ncbi:MAG: hypothetical protein WDM77_09945 [Steroidobacteraceae bacterium]
MTLMLSLSDLSPITGVTRASMPAASGALTSLAAAPMVLRVKAEHSAVY